MLDALALALVLAPVPEPRAAIDRAGVWMAAYAASEQPLNFDAAIVLALLRRRCDTPALGEAFERANARLDRDRGHPMRRFFEPDFRLPPEASRGWEVPQGPAPRINPDRAVTEALHCRDHGWRDEATAYVCGPLRDGGGFYTAHALWALTLARRQGCVEESRAAACGENLRAEIIAAQPLPFIPWTTLEIDLFAERLVMLLVSGPLPAAAEPWPKRLLELQNRDGSWGVDGTEPPYFRFHATMMATWALAESAACASGMSPTSRQPPNEYR